MSRSESATLLSFPRGSIGTRRAISRAEIEQAMERGRTLRARTLRDGFAGAFRFLVNSCSLRGLRVPSRIGEQRHSCC